MSQSSISRRDLFGMSIGAVATAGLAPLAFARPLYLSNGSSLGQNVPQDAENYQSSIKKAFTFQEMMMDAYASGETVRLTQSYSDQALGATAFTYDNAVSIHAYLCADAAMISLERKCWAMVSSTRRPTIFLSMTDASPRLIS